MTFIHQLPWHIILMVLLVSFSPVAFLPTYFSIRNSREHHSDHISDLWYVFFLSAILFLVLFTYIYLTVVWHWPRITGLFGDVAIFINDEALNIRSEVLFVFGVSALVLVPQLLTYLVSGCFGCARLPSAFKWIDGFIAWSFIKFFTILAGIMGAQAIFDIYGYPYREPSDIPSRIFFMSLFLSVSFSLFFAFYERQRFFAFLQQLPLAGPVASVNARMTRYAKTEKEEQSDVSITEYIFDYIVRLLWPRLLRLIIKKALKTAGIDSNLKWPPSGPATTHG